MPEWAVSALWVILIAFLTVILLITIGGSAIALRNEWRKKPWEDQDEDRMATEEEKAEIRTFDEDIEWRNKHGLP